MSNLLSRHLRGVPPSASRGEALPRRCLGSALRFPLTATCAPSQGPFRCGAVVRCACGRWNSPYCGCHAQCSSHLWRGPCPAELDVTLAPLTLTSFAYKGPAIERVVPDQLPTSGGRLTLFGSSLGAGHVSIKAADGLECSIVSTQADCVVVDVGPRTGSSKLLVLRNSSGVSKARFSYAAPVITGIDTGGVMEFPTWPRNSTVTVNGLNFGADADVGLVQLTIGGIPGRVHLSQEHTALIVTISPEAGGHAPVQVSVAGLSSADSPTFCVPYARAHILACTKSGSPGGHFAVSGRNFGTGVNARIVVTIGGQPCTGVNLLTPHAKIEAIVPPGTGSKQSVAVTILGMDATSEAGCTFSYAGSRSRSNASPVPDSSECVDIFCQAQLARYYKNGIRQAETDMFGQPFTRDSAKQASEAWKDLDTRIRRMSSKVDKELLWKSMTGVWKCLKQSRGLNIEEDPKVKKRVTS